jgi:hypothetical protein
MAATSHKTAPAGSVCCFLCHRYLDPEKIDGHRCADRDGCQRASARMLGRAPQATKQVWQQHGGVA